MRSYHKHKGLNGSHKISANHKNKSAKKYHELELNAYNKSNTAIKNNTLKEKLNPALSNALSKAKLKFSKTFEKKVIDAKSGTIEFPIDKNGTIIVDMTKIKNSMYVKFISIVEWHSKRQEVVELKIKSLPDAKKLTESQWKNSKLFK